MLLLTARSKFYKNFNKIFIRSIRISKDDPSLIEKHRTGLEKEELMSKNYDPYYVKTPKGFVRRKLPYLGRKNKYFVRRPRWLYRVRRRSPSFYHTKAYLSHRSTRYKFSARMAGKDLRRRTIIYLKKGQSHKTWFRWFYRKSKNYGPWVKRRYTRYRKRNRYYGILVRPHPTMVQYKKGLRQFKYFRYSPRVRHKVRSLIHARLMKRFRFTRLRRIFRLLSKPRRKVKLGYRYRRAAVQLNSLRKVYRVLSYKRGIPRSLGSETRAFLSLSLKYKKRIQKLQRKRILRKRVKRRVNRFGIVTKKIINSRLAQNYLHSQRKRYALNLFRHLLQFKPEIRFGAKFMFRSLLFKPLGIRRLKKHIRARKLFLFGKLRFKSKKYRLRFFSYAEERLYDEAFRENRDRLKSLPVQRRKLRHATSVRHYRHNILLKFRRTKFHKKRLAYISFIKALKRKNVTSFLAKKSLSFVNNNFNLFRGSKVINVYTQARLMRALRRYEHLPHRFFKAYEAFQAKRISYEKGQRLRMVKRKYKEKHRLAVKLRSRRRHKLIREERKEKLSFKLKGFRRLRHVRKLIMLKSKKLLSARVVTTRSLLTNDNLFLIVKKLKFKLKPRLYRVEKLYSFINKSFINNFSVRKKFYKGKLESSYSLWTSLHRKLKGIKLRQKRLTPFGLKSLVHPTLKAYLLKRFSFGGKRSKWRKAITRNQYFGRERIQERLALKRYIKTFNVQKALWLPRKRSLRPRYVTQLRHRIVKLFTSKLRSKMVQLKKQVLARRRKITQRAQQLKWFKRRRRYIKFKKLSRKERARRRTLRYRVRRRVRRRLFLTDQYPLWPMKAHPFHKLIENKLYRRPKVRLKIDSGFGAVVPGISKLVRRRLFVQKQRLKFLRKGLLIKKGREYNTKRRFYELKNKYISLNVRKSMYKRTRVYRRLLLIKKRKVHIYRLWWNLKRRRYMHRRRFLSSKPKRRHKRFISHLPAVHITQTNSNYFIYIIVNNQVIFVKSTGHCGFEGSKRKAPYAVEKLGIDVGNWLLNKNMRYVTLRPHFPKLFYVARLALKGMLKPYRLKPPRKFYHLRTNMLVQHKKPEKRRVEVMLIRRLLIKAHNGLRLPTRRRL